MQVASCVADASRAQNLFDGAEQPVAVLEHDLVKLLAALVVHGPRLQSFEIQTDGGDGSFQFVGHGIDKRVVLCVAANFAHQKRGVQHHARDQQQRQQDAEEQQNAVVPAEQHPSDVQQQDERNQPDAESDEERDRFAASANDHMLIIELIYDCKNVKPGENARLQLYTQDV